MKRSFHQLHSRHRAIIGGVLLLLLVLSLRSCLSPPDGRSWVRMKEMELPITLTESGLLQPITLTRVSAHMDGSLIEVVADGKFVKQGERLFLIDEDELSENIQNLEEQIADIESDIEVAEREFRATQKKAKATLARDEAELVYAKAQQAYETVPIQPLDRQKLDINIELATLDLADAQAEYERMQKLVKRNFASALQLAPLERRLDSAKRYLSELQLDLRLRLKGLPEEEKIALEAAVRQAQSAVDRSTQYVQATLHKLQTAMDIQRTKLRHLHDDLALLKEQETQTEIFAPMDGVVRLRRKLNWTSGNWQPVSTGVKTWNKDVLADLVSPSTMQVEMMLHESDRILLSTGLPVQVELTAYPDQRLPGTLTRLSNLGQDRADLAPPGFEVSPANQSVFRGIVAFDAQELAIRPGMSANVHISMDPSSPRTVLPRDAVGYIDHIPHVRTGKKTVQAIEGYPITPQWFEVTGGLKTSKKVRRPFQEVQP